MKFFPYRELCAHHSTLIWIIVTFWITLTSSPSYAQQYRLRTQSLAKATQFVRSDRTIAAQRPVSQTLSLWGYNVLGIENTPLQLHLSLRYFHDFANTSNRRDPYLKHRFNRVSIDQAYFDWSPLRLFRVKGGRFIQRSVFQAKDLDGVSGSIVFGDKTRWKTSAYVGRHVVGRPESLMPDHYDIQGKPIELRQELDDPEFIWGANSTLRFDAGSGTLAYEKRASVDHEVDERFAFTASGNPTKKTIVSALMSFHILSKRIQHGKFQWTWRPTNHFFGSLGFEHLIPIFDASSIFNFFGTNPTQSLYTTLWLGNNRRYVESRAWIKVIQSDAYSADFGSGAQDLRTFGASIRYHERLRLFGQTLHLRPSISFQPGDEKGYSKDQFIADFLLRMPLGNVRLIASSSFLWVGGDSNTRQPDAVFALTQRIGLDFATSFGVFSMASVLQNSNQSAPHLNLFASFETEFWL